MESNNTPDTVISAEVEITGAIKSNGSVRIDGKLEGELHCNGDAIIGKTAQVTGNLNVSSVSIEGTLKGNIVAKDRIAMKSTARVNGDIKAKRLSVEDGVTFVGRSEVNPSGSPINQAPVIVETEGEDEAEAEVEGAAAARSLGRR